MLTGVVPLTHKKRSNVIYQINKKFPFSSSGVVCFKYLDCDNIVPKCSVGSLFYFFFAIAYIRNSANLFQIAES